mmetsp:Transcript_31333/g.73061  ORF Transcript_31333/g.73061 Transcript_31333/m.73061 type:complete len:225 (-) Transcript_31333:135-809(-)
MVDGIRWAASVPSRPWTMACRYKPSQAKARANRRPLNKRKPPTRPTRCRKTSLIAKLTATPCTKLWMGLPFAWVWQSSASQMPLRRCLASFPVTWRGSYETPLLLRKSSSLWSTRCPMGGQANLGRETRLRSHRQPRREGALTSGQAQLPPRMQQPSSALLRPGRQVRQSRTRGQKHETPLGSDTAPGGTPVEVQPLTHVAAQPTRPAAEAWLLRVRLRFQLQL